MIDPLQTVLIVACLLVAVVALVQVAIDRPVGDGLVGLCGLVEIGLLVQAAVGIVQAFGDHDAPVVTFVGYLLACLLVLPAGAIWSLGERTRGGTAVLAVAGLTTAFLVVRLSQLWSA